jgi:hypothetical protein
MKPTVNNRASICNWELNFSFRTKAQICQFVELLLEDEVDFYFEYRKELDETSELHLITVTGCWANNLVRVSKMAEEADYKDSFEEAYET